MQCVLLGNFGVGNLGDEAIRDAILAAHPDHEWTVLSAHPVGRNELPRLPCGIRSFFSLWPVTLYRMARCDAVVFGGGTLFTDVESVRACYLWWWHAFVARLFRRPILLAFQGIGPFRTAIGKKLALWVLRRADFLSVRDALSYDRLSSYNIKNIVQTFDPVYSLFQNKKKENCIKKLLVIIPRHNSSNIFLKEVERQLKITSWTGIRLLSLQPRNTSEQNVLRDLHDRLVDRHYPTEIIPVRSVSGLSRWVSDAAQVITERYHGALAAHAASVSVSVIAQEGDDKLDAVRSLPSREKLLFLLEQGHRALADALRSLASRRKPASAMLART